MFVGAAFRSSLNSNGIDKTGITGFQPVQTSRDACLTENPIPALIFELRIAAQDRIQERLKRLLRTGAD